MPKVWGNLRAKLCYVTRMKKQSRKKISTTNDINNSETIIEIQELLKTLFGKLAYLVIVYSNINDLY